MSFGGGWCLSSRRPPSTDAEERIMPTTNTQGYVDIYLLPIPATKVDEYVEQAMTFGTVAREHGALSYREFRADDVGDGFATSDGQLLTAAVVEFNSREHRDDVMGKVMSDPRVTAMASAEQIADMSQMRYGGFETFVTA
jgi:uncharacterized protein YbaA (DUF1428 family)